MLFHKLALSSSPVIGEKPRASATSSGTNGFLYNGLNSGFVASPSVAQYYATPLQAQNANAPMLQVQNPQNYLMQRQLQYAQHQHQLHQQQRQHAQTLQRQQMQQRPDQQPGVDQNSAPLTGSLPSKFAHDLIVQSPNTSIGGMFQDWPFPPNTGTMGRSNSTLPQLQNGQTHSNNGSSGLSPYINVSQTPTSKTFNFGDNSATYNSEKRQDEK